MMIKKIKIFLILTALVFVAQIALAATSPANYMSANSYNNLYPYMNNTMRTSLNPGTTPSQSNAQINVLTRTKQATNTTARKVVPRTATTQTAARSATNNTATRSASTTTATNALSNARAAVSTATAARNNTATTSARRVVARSGTTSNTMQVATTRTSRGDVSTYANQNATGVITYDDSTETIPSSRCMADYIECMNGYCERENAAYNRCYCSTKLAQIDSQYQSEIDRLIKEIIVAQSTNHWTDEEMNEYWMDTIGKYTGDNSWVNLENALNIDWSSTESRVRGQQAFATGHSYCVQHLKGCAYMATNLRDAYRSEIARDCSTYESSLKKIKNAAESILEAYK